MSADLGPTHYADVSWWDGSVTTFCGIKWTKKQAKGRRDTRWFPTPICPKCKAIKKGGRR